MAAVTAALVGLGVSTAMGAYASHEQGDAAKKAGEQGAASDRDALAFEREQADLDRQQYDQTESYNRAQAEQAKREEQRRYDMEMQISNQRYGAADAFNREQYATRRSDMAPYREEGTAAVRQLGAYAQRTLPPDGVPTAPDGSPATMAELARMRAGR